MTKAKHERLLREEWNAGHRERDRREVLHQEQIRHLTSREHALFDRHTQLLRNAADFARPYPDGGDPPVDHRTHRIRVTNLQFDIETAGLCWAIPVPQMDAFRELVRQSGL